jgi:hypothetical protein
MEKIAYDYYLESENKEQFIIDKTTEWNLPEGDLIKILELQCKDKKLNDYPKIGDQLDLLWHDINDGIFGETAKESKWFQEIKIVKERYPKTN